MTPRQRLLVAALALAAVAAFGTLGYHVIEGWPLFDAFYMTVITVATVGYGETHPLSSAGRAFTIALILSGIGLLTYFFSLLTAFLVEGELQEAFRKRRMEKQIAQLKDHYILCGGGPTGRCVAEELLKTGRSLVVVDRDPAVAARYAEEGIPALAGDADQDEVLRRAGVERARGLISCLPEDKDNLFAVITARGINPNLRIVAKASGEQAAVKFRRSGADAVVSPHFIGGLRLASEAVRPAVVSFLDSMLRGPEAGLRIEEVSVGAAARGRPLSALKSADLDLLVLALKDADGGTRFNPSPETSLKDRDVLVVMGPAEHVQRLQRHIGGS